jgi:hypothetical protein
VLITQSRLAGLGLMAMVVDDVVDDPGKASGCHLSRVDTDLDVAWNVGIATPGVGALLS